MTSCTCAIRISCLSSSRSMSVTFAPRDFANSTAAIFLPTPSGPEKRYACAGRFRLRMPRSRAIAASLPMNPSKDTVHRLLDVAEDALRGAGGVDDFDALPVPLRQLQESGAHFLLVVQPLALDAVVADPVAAAREAGVQVEEHHEVGLPELRDLLGDGDDRVDPDPARGALVGGRGVVITVTDDVDAFRQRGADDLVDELGAAGHVEKELGEGDHLGVFRVEEQLADFLAEGG